MNIRKKLKTLHCLFLGLMLMHVLPQQVKSEFHNRLSFDSVPKPVVPVYKKLKPLYINTVLVESSRPQITIYAPGEYSSQGLAIQAAIRKLSGTTVPVITSKSNAPAIPLQGNLILLGNRSTNDVISKLYDRGFTYLDLKYPGPDGYVVRSLHNPYGNGYNVLFAGGSNLEGVKQAAHALIELIDAAGGKKGSLSLHYLCRIKLASGYLLPDSSRRAEIWEASKQYGSEGYFGWNSISKYMALFYMTGEEKFLHQFLRLAFPDTQAIREMEALDGELIENKKDPLAGPYHYGAYMMIGLWDLIEETPLLSDEMRLNITNAFARQLTHRVVEYGSIYSNTKAPSYVGDRHDDWAALSLYVLALYFQRDYPGNVWEHSIKAADLHFSTLKNTSWTAGNNDHLFWFTSFYDPMIDYLVFSGKRDPQTLANLRNSLRTQEIIYTGNIVDWGLKASSLSMLNKAAYILNDGRWLYFRERSGVNSDIFRLGQSFWPGPELKPEAPRNLLGKWNIEWMQKEMWQRRNSSIPLDRSFRWGSYRSETNEGGDYLLIKGYNGAGRNPYHSFDILELRLNGATLLKGYHNQVLTSADGMVEPKVAMDAALLYNGESGEFVTVVGEVPDLPFVNWRRTIAMRKNKYALITDELTSRTDSDNLFAETSWETAGATWVQDGEYLKIAPQEFSSSPSKHYELHSSERMDVKAGKITHMNWRGMVTKGKRKVIFHLLAENAEGKKSGLACLPITDNAVALALPEASIAVAGQYAGMKGDMLVLNKHSLYGRQLQTAGLNDLLMSSNYAIDVNWEFESGKLVVDVTRPVSLLLSLSSSKIMVNGKAVIGKRYNQQYRFNLEAGRYQITGAKPSLAIMNKLGRELMQVLDRSRVARNERFARKVSETKSTVLPLNIVMRGNIGGSPVPSIIIPSPQGEMLCMATGKTVTLFNAKGKEVRKMNVEGNVQVLRWWTEYNLLLVGCADEQVIAFDEEGKKKWQFTSVMDQAVYEAGKQYWFKSAYPGIHGLYSGAFDNNKSRAFVGSACTLEIIDENGQLVKRLPVFWSVIKQFMMLDDAEGNKKLLVGGWQSGTNDLVVIGSKKMEEIGRGYDRVPEGHSFVGGWMNMNRYDNFLVDLNNDGNKEVVSAINGVWNRITVYTAKGKPLYNSHFGPGNISPRANLRMMDVADLDGDGKSEIIVALSSGLVDVLNAEAIKVWATILASPPTVLKVIKNRQGNWICIGCEDGSVIAMDAKGRILRQGNVNGRPVDLQVLQTAGGPVAVITTEKGETKGFQLGIEELASGSDKK